MAEEISAPLPAEFHHAAHPATPTVEPPRVMVSLPLPANVVAWFQSEGEQNDWQRHMEGVLRFYMETNLIRAADMEAEAERAIRMGQETAGPSQPS